MAVITKSRDRKGRNGSLQIAVEGCIGIGKTTLARKLARARKSELLLEAFAQHPFLPDFYANPAAHAFQTEMHFVLLHYHQLRSLEQKADTETFTDFTFYKDRVFADLTLTRAAERSIFSRLYSLLLRRLRAPDMIIYLTGTDGLIIQRLQARNRSIESKIDPGYLRRLKRKLDDSFLRKRQNVLVIDADSFDCIKHPKLVGELSSEIDRRIRL